MAGSTPVLILHRPTAQSRHALNGEIIRIRRGLAIYRTFASPFWFARIWIRQSQKYLVRSTKETARIRARDAAEELVADLKGRLPEVPRQYTFKHFAKLFVDKGQKLVEAGERNSNYMRTSRLFLDNDEWGLIRKFGGMDVRNLTTRDFTAFVVDLEEKRPDLSTSSLNMLTATFRNVMKMARDLGVIDEPPETPRRKRKDNPRPFFRFYPLVPKDRDSFAALLAAAKDLSEKKFVVRGVQITDELTDIIQFVIQTFVRPTTTELYALRHSDVEVTENPKRLLLTIRDGKTGYRHANSMPEAVEIYQRIQNRYPKAGAEDYLFFPHYINRSTASRTVQRQFNTAMERAGLGKDPFTGMNHTVYSLRHTAICMRIIMSEGRVNIFNLAKNAGTSVEQIERFYARNLPLSAEMARNLHEVVTHE